MEASLKEAKSSKYMIGGLTEDAIAQTHKWQRDSTQTTPNDCTEAAIAIIVEQALIIRGYEKPKFSFAEIARMMDKWFFFVLYRVPAWFPIIPGATPPGGATRFLNRLSSKLEKAEKAATWQAEKSTGNSKSDLIENINKGYPTMIYGMSGSTPHAIVIAGYNTDTDEWIVLDPGDKERIKYWNTSKLMNFWKGLFGIYPARTMITIILDH